MIVDNNKIRYEILQYTLENILLKYQYIFYGIRGYY